jgi:hypothetical protein
MARDNTKVPTNGLRIEMAFFALFFVWPVDGIDQPVLRATKNSWGFGAACMAVPVVVNVACKGHSRWPVLTIA